MSSILIQEVLEYSLPKSSVILFSIYDEDRFIVSSPYPDHLLDLETLDEPSKELAILFQELQPNEGYLDLPYDQAFNWSPVLSKLSSDFPATEFFMVAFRSCLALSSVSSEIVVELHSQDKLSHFEASESGGLLKYWFGVPASDRRNLATCVWTNRDWALKANRLPQHSKAVEIVLRGVYESWTMERYTLKVGGGKQWTIEKFNK